jgi:FkbM family methyltransferase
MSAIRYSNRRPEQWIWTDLLEKDLRSQYWNIMPGDVVFDIGADFGSFTLPAIAKGGYVYAFEPRPEGIRELQENLNLNGFQSRCKILGLALTAPSMENYTVHMNKPKGVGWGGEWATILPGYFDGETMEVHTSTIDAVVSKLEIPRLDWIKMDVEGAELMVLDGGTETIRKFTPNLLIECHNDHVKDKNMEGRISEKVFSMVPDYYYARTTDLLSWLGSGNPHLFFTINP